MALGLLGKKIGMSRIFRENGEVCPVTIVQAGPCAVLEHRTVENHGYGAVRIAFAEVAAKKLTKPLRGQFQVLGASTYKHITELPSSENLPEPGTMLTVEIFAVGDKVHVQGKTKGRGFAGVIKRHGFSGGRDSHGSNFHRAPGSIGTNTTPGRTAKGRRMPGHYGDAKRTIQNLEIVKILPEQNILFLKGAVPGAKNGLLRIIKA